MRWGIVGTGTIAQAFADALARVPGASLAAVASRDPARARAFGTPFGAAEVAADAAALAALPGVDVVYVATPHHRHEADALAVIAAAKPVLVREAARHSTPPPPPASPRRPGPRASSRWRGCGRSACRSTARPSPAIAAGEIGEVREIAGSFAVPEPYDPASRFWDPAQGGGALLDRGVYLVALALALLEAPSRSSPPTPPGAERRRRRRRLRRSPTPPGGAASSRCRARQPRGQPAGRSRAAPAAASSSSRSPARPAYVVPPPCAAPAAAPAAGGRLAGLKAAVKRQPLLRRRRPRADARRPLRPRAGSSTEIAEVERCLAAGLRESPLVPLDRSVAALALLDAVRDRPRARR